MSLGLYLDHNVPRAVAKALRDRGVDVLTAIEDGAATVSDDEVLDRATLLRRILVSKDADFRAIAARRQRSGQPFHGIFTIRRESYPTAALVADLTLVALATDLDEWEGRLTYLPL